MLSDDQLKTPPAWAAKDVQHMYLFGSRSMALRKGYKDIVGDTFDTNNIRKHLTDETDFDYAAPYSKVLAEKLEARGWKYIDTAGLYHPCKLMKGLFVKKQDGQSVQILLRTNHELFTKMWDSINPGFWYHYIWKSSPDFMFKKFHKKEQKKIITEILDQLYNNINREYGYQ